MEISRLFAGRRIFLSLPLAALLGCGSTPTPSAPAPQYLSLNGNWEAIGFPSLSGPLLTTPIADFTGAIQSTNGSVTGTLHAFDASNFLNPCVALTQDLTATGTISTSGNLVLSIPNSGGTATLTVTLGSNLQSYAMGTWQILGGPCAMPATSMAITQFAPLTGTYTGTLTNYGTTSNSTNITAILTQSTTPDVDGRFPLTGTITATGACTGTFPLTPETVSGNGVAPNAGGFLMPAATIDGPFLPTAAAFQSTFVEIYSTNCSVGSLTGILTRQ